MGHISRKGSLSKVQNVRERVRIFKDWHKVMFPLNRVYKGVQKLHLRNGASAYVRDVRSMDVNIVRDVLGKDEYAVATWLRVPENAIVFDLGANIGTFCIAVYNLCPTVHITAYEPHPGNFKMLKMNASFATLIQKAATEKTGTVHLEDNTNSVGLQVVKQGGISVEASSLDDILKDVEKVDLLKIDIEGSEYGLLDAASSQTFSKVQKIIMETHNVSGFDDLEWAETILTKNGFKITWIDPLGVIYGERL